MIVQTFHRASTKSHSNNSTLTFKKSFHAKVHSDVLQLSAAASAAVAVAAARATTPNECIIGRKCDILTFVIHFGGITFSLILSTLRCLN